MRTIITTLLLASFFLLPDAGQASSGSVTCLATVQPIHPQVVNRLLGKAAERLSISHGQARQWYNEGRITIAIISQDLGMTYDVSLDGVCILIYIEDL